MKAFLNKLEIFLLNRLKESFIDCSILALMKKRGISIIASFDADFKDLKNIKVLS